MGEKELCTVSSLNSSFFRRLDDLLIGAPLYTVKKDGRILADAGRVDIYYQTPEVYYFGLLFSYLICLYFIFNSIILYVNKQSKEHATEDV